MKAVCTATGRVVGGVGGVGEEAVGVRVLVLSWDAGSRAGGPDHQAAGLAVALAAGGDDVRLVTRLGEDHRPPQLPGVEVHAVVDAPPILPTELDEPLLAALAFAGRATSVAVRRLEERPVDVVHAEGWQTGPVAAALRTSHGVPVLAALSGADVTGPEGSITATARQLASDAVVVACRSTADRTAVAAATGVTLVVLPAGSDRPARRPGPPPAAGPLYLAVVGGRDHREHRVVARGIQRSLSQPRRVTRSWTRRPFVVVVLDPHDLTAATRALALGVPLLAVEGPVGELAVTTGGGRLVSGDPAAIAAAVDQLGERPELAASLGATGRAASDAHRWDVVADTWRRAAPAAPACAPPRPLHAADATG